MNVAEKFTLTLNRFIRAPRERVFDAFTTEAGIASWMGPRGMHVSVARADTQIGGAWQVQMVARDGSRHDVGGQFRVLERPHRLAYTWQWQGDANPMSGMSTLVEVELLDKDGGTELRMTHSGFPAAAVRDGHNQGWSSTLNRLNDVLDPRGTAGTITLLGDARSTYTRTARMALAEKAVAYTLHSCAPHTAEIEAVHPFGLIPGLRDGDILLWETAAIVQYLDECFDTGVSLRPGSISARARCTQWISMVNSHLYDTMGRRYVLQVFFPSGAGGQPDRTVIDKALGEMRAQLAALDKAYAGQDYVAGASVSAADLFIAPILAHVSALPEGGALMAQYPNVVRAHAVMRARASFSATQP
ncbi:MAG: SRPBCC domain-containing protein [Betaproteobacteria bacterium]